jgi:hypothetical protein
MKDPEEHEQSQEKGGGLGFREKDRGSSQNKGGVDEEAESEILAEGVLLKNHCLGQC